MNESAAKRKLDKKLDSLARDSEGGVGNARSLTKATRAYGKAIIESALDETTFESTNDSDSCVICDKACNSVCCSDACRKEAVNLGLIKGE